MKKIILLILFIGASFSLKAQENYKCDYSKTSNYFLVLQVGNDKSIDEIWGIGKSDIDSFPNIAKSCIDWDMFVLKGKQHIRSRIEPIEIHLELDEISIRRIDDSKPLITNNWYIMITYKSHKTEEHYEMIPILPDGRIVLGSRDYQ